MNTEEEKTLLQKFEQFLDDQTKSESPEEKKKREQRELWNNHAAKFNVIAGAFYMLTTIFFFTHITDNNKWRGKIDTILKTDSTIAALRLRQEIRRQLGAHLSLNSYFQIEVARSEAVSDALYELGKLSGVREEELDPFRIKTKRTLNSSLNVGVARKK